MSPFKGSPGPLHLDKLVLSARSGAYIVGPVKVKTQVSMFKGEEFQDGGCRGLEQVGSLGDDAGDVPGKLPLLIRPAHNSSPSPKSPPKLRSAVSFLELSLTLQEGEAPSTVLLEPLLLTWISAPFNQHGPFMYSLTQQTSTALPAMHRAPCRALASPFRERGGGETNSAWESLEKFSFGEDASIES